MPNIDNSSAIIGVEYYDRTKTLVIDFNNGSRYKYFKVPKKIYTDMLASESVGKYFWRVIRRHPDKYPYEKILAPGSYSQGRSKPSLG